MFWVSLQGAGIGKILIVHLLSNKMPKLQNLEMKANDQETVFIFVYGSQY